MSLQTNITAAFVRVATEFKTVRTSLWGNGGSLSSLTTTDKSSIVAAINEVKATPGGVQINDSADSTTTTNSSTKISSKISAAVAALSGTVPTVLDTLQEIDAALNNDPNFAATMTTALGNRLRIDTATQGLTGTQQTNAQTNLNVYATGQVGDVANNFVTDFVNALT